ncbi:MAG: hypothetical protein B6I18_00705 [Bacteroidetes bacterium 4572_112]|nr:MAG: hypothetical protein B6I18_00705 [Bacteroidetes bacterium 4572_112]
MNPFIFIIDDDKIFAESLKRKLLVRGFSNIKVCHTADCFINNLDITPELVFLDYQIGDSSGMDILQKVKSIIPSNNIIMVSSVESINIIDQAKSFGIKNYIIKGNRNMNTQIDDAISELFIKTSN